MRVIQWTTFILVCALSITQRILIYLALGAYRGTVGGLYAVGRFLDELAPGGRERTWAKKKEDLLDFRQVARALCARCAWFDPDRPDVKRCVIGRLPRNYYMEYLDGHCYKAACWHFVEKRPGRRSVFAETTHWDFMGAYAKLKLRAMGESHSRYDLYRDPKKVWSWQHWFVFFCLVGPFGLMGIGAYLCGGFSVLMPALVSNPLTFIIFFLCPLLCFGLALIKRAPLFLLLMNVAAAIGIWMGLSSVSISCWLMDSIWMWVEEHWEVISGLGVMSIIFGALIGFAIWDIRNCGGDDW